MPTLDLSHLSPTFLLPTHLTPDVHTALRSQLLAHNCPLAATASTASLFLADINTVTRCQAELRKRGIHTAPEPFHTAPLRVVKLRWFTESVEAGSVLPIEAYTVYAATVSAVEVTPVPSPEGPRKTAQGGIVAEEKEEQEEQRRGVLQRAKMDAVKAAREISGWRSERDEYQRGVYGGRITDELIKLSKSAGRNARPSTPEYEDERTKARGINEMPEWVKRNVKFSCCRSTPAASPNADFIAQLHRVREHRVLTSDDVGVRAYSTAIASVQAYPHVLTSSSEVALLPGCGVKISALFHSWKRSNQDPKLRTIPDVEKLRQNENLKGLEMLHKIWGVGPEAAREFWFVKGWRSIDDVVEYGWRSLTRAQQIGVKYYDDFQKPVPRYEAERVRDIVMRHASSLRPGITSILVGSYRRGSPTLGDVDLLISHPDSRQVSGPFLEQLVASLESEGCINYTLRLDRSSPPPRKTAGFNTLQSAVLAWQEQHYSDVRLRIPRPPAGGGRNRNLRRRVDIVVTMPETAGMALMALTGARTWVRDLRLWCEVRGWKFMPDGLWERNDERVGGVDGALRSVEGWEEAERRVFEGMGLEWRAPEERCTG